MLPDIEDMRAAAEARKTCTIPNADPRVHDFYNAKVRETVRRYYRYDQAKMKIVLMMQEGRTHDFGIAVPSFPFCGEDG